MLIQKEAAISLSSGTQAVAFGEAQKVISAVVFFDDPEVSSYAYAASTSITGSTVTVTIKKQNLGSPGSWGNAASSDWASNPNKLTVIAECE
jgi:hypothetical protein